MHEMPVTVCNATDTLPPHLTGMAATKLDARHVLYACTSHHFCVKTTTQHGTHGTLAHRQPTPCGKHIHVVSSVPRTGVRL